MSAMQSDSVTRSSPWFAVSTGLAGIIVGYVLGTTLSGATAVLQQPGVPTVNQPAAPVAPEPPATPPSVDDDAVLGDKNAKVTLIEFTDYQCPFCGRHYTQTYQQIKKEYIDTGKVKLVVRDFPLGFHPHAQKAAEATECAGEQNKFWEMHDKIFSTQDAWSNGADSVATFKQYAADLKMDTSKFNTCLDTGAMADEVNKDLADGSTSGIQGTPGFWVLGPGDKSQKISGAVPFAQFKAAIDAML